MRTKLLFDFFQKQGFPYDNHCHEPVSTVKEGRHLSVRIPGAHSKNLFLKDKKKSFILVSVLEDKRVNLKLLAKMLGRGSLSFASPEELQEKLKLTPGSVTPYGLINDAAQEVSFILDADLVNYPLVNFHPLRNDMTVGLPIAAFLEFFRLINHPPIVTLIPTSN